MGVLGDLKSGLEGGVNWGLNKAEHGLTEGKKLVGEGVDWGAHKVGDHLDQLGLHDAADTVDDWGDGVASDLGATPGEQQLGETDEANELIHGNPAKIQETAKRLKDFFTAFDKVGTGMKKVDSSSWQGDGGDAFRKKFHVHPTKWLHAADACGTAASALDVYAETVRWAQRQAQDAVDLYNKGKKVSEDAMAAYQKGLDSYKARIVANEDPGPEPEAFHDPGRPDIQAARDKLAEARKQRNAAATAAESKMKAALAHAPSEPPPLDRLGNDFADGYKSVNIELAHVVGGAVKGTAGLLNFARGLNPMDPYSLTHPAEYMQGVSMTLSGLVSTAAHPEQAVKAAVDGFRKDPSEFIGRLIPELIGTKGAGFARGAVVRGVEEAAAESTAANIASKGLKYGDELPGAGTKDWSGLAKSTDHVSENAIHYDSVDPETAQKFLDDQYPWMKDVNNTGMPGYTQNCSHNVVAVDRRLDGIEVSASPRATGAHIPPEQLGLKNQAPGQYHMVDSYDDIIRDLNGRGEGARSAVYISRADGTAHVFNAVKTEHGVVFLDGQSGTLGMLEKDATSIGHIPYRDGVP